MVPPTVQRFFSFRAVVYFDDHAPIHVHVYSSSKDARFYLDSKGYFILDTKKGTRFTNKELKIIKTSLNPTLVLEFWNRNNPKLANCFYDLWDTGIRLY